MLGTRKGNEFRFQLLISCKENKFFVLLEFLVVSIAQLQCLRSDRHVGNSKPGKPGLTSFSETLALFFIQFLSFRKKKVQESQKGYSKSFRAY